MLFRSEHESQGWRINEVAPDFRLEDVWALPAHGGAEDFARLLEVMASLDPADAEADSCAAMTKAMAVKRWNVWRKRPGRMLDIRTSQAGADPRQREDMR